LMNIQKYSTINTVDPVLLSQIPGLMAVKANVLAYTTVFYVAGAIMFFGAISAFFVRAKSVGAKHSSEPIEM